MSSTRFFTADALKSVAAALAEQGRVLVPVRRPAVRESVIFAPYTKGMPLDFAKATISPKEAVLPKCETLVTYSKTKNPENPADVTLTLDDTPQAEPTVVFGCRPCDARGFAVLDRPYLNGPFADPYYKARRDLLTVVTLACPSVGPTCFCNWTGGGPACTEGSDAMLTAVDGGYLLEALTEKGEALAAALDAAGVSLSEGESHVEAARSAREAVEKQLAAAPDLSEAPKRIAARFADEAFWEEQTAQCLSCGACTYMCPTCYCFNITDEGDGTSAPGRRLRTWDSCMSPLFTREASGHNARMKKSQRMRNRVSHKFATYPENNGGAFSCSGCGRCIANCPVNLDIRAIVLAAAAPAQEKA